MIKELRKVKISDMIITEWVKRNERFDKRTNR